MVEFGYSLQLRQLGQNRAHLFFATIYQKADIGPAFGNARQTRQRRRRSVVPAHGVNGNAYHAAMVFRWPETGGISAKCGENTGFT